MLVVLITINLFLLAFTLHPLTFAQQPQAQAGQPIYTVNSEYVQGVGPGYWPTAGSGLVLNLTAGTAVCSNTVQTYAGGTLTLMPSATNYVYLNPSNHCAPASNTTGFATGSIPIATVVTTSTVISSVSDVRTMFVSSGVATSGTVTSVGMAGDGIIFSPTVSGSPITSSGTLTPQLLAQTANTVLAGPGLGPAATPAFRALAPADLPATISSNTTGSAATAAALATTPTQCAGNNWATGISSSGNSNCSQPGFGNLAGSLGLGQTPLTTAGDLLFTNSTPALARLPTGGTNQFLGTSGGLPTWMQPTFSNLSGTATVPQGGTGQTTASAAFNALSPLTTEGDLHYYHSSANTRLGIGSNGQCLTSNGTDPLWGSCGSAGVSSVSGDGNLITNSSSTGAVTLTLGSLSPHYFWGNNTSGSATAAKSLIGTSDTSVNWYAAGGGTAQAQTVTLSPAATALTAGLTVRWKPTAANTGSGPTLTVNGLTATSITKCGTTALVANDLTTANIATAVYDGTEFQLLNPMAGACAGSSGVSSFTGDGSLLSNSGSTGTVTATLANASANSFWGNNTGSTGSPGYKNIGTSDTSTHWYAAGGGSAQGQTVTLSPAATALAAGLTVRWKPTAANTGSGPTLAVNGLTATTITKCGTTALVANDLTTANIATAVYDGTEFQLLNPMAAGCGGGGNLSTSGSPSQYQIGEFASGTALAGISPSATSGVPLISQGSSSNPTFGTTAIAGGGTGQTTASAAFNALSPLTTEGDLHYYHSSSNARLAIGSNGLCLTSNGTDPVWGSCSSGSGTVTSVGLSMPSLFSVSGSPVTGSGTLTAALANQNANLIMAGPASGSAAAPTFRALVGADLPAPGASTLGGIESVTCAAGQFMNQVSTAGVPACATPSGGESSTGLGNGTTVIDATLQAGADFGSKVNAAIAALPSTGGVVDARGFSSSQSMTTSINLGSDSKPVTLLLPAVTITPSSDAQLFLYNGSKVIGQGMAATFIGGWGYTDPVPFFTTGSGSYGDHIYISDLNLINGNLASQCFYFPMLQDSVIERTVGACGITFLGGTGSLWVGYSTFNDNYWVGGGPAQVGNAVVLLNGNSNIFHGGRYYSNSNTAIFLGPWVSSQQFEDVNIESSGLGALISGYGTDFKVKYLEGNRPGGTFNSTVNVTSGTHVAWVSGQQFTMGTAWNGKNILINGVLCVIASVTDATDLVLASSTTNAVGVTMYLPAVVWQASTTYPLGSVVFDTNGNSEVCMPLSWPNSTITNCGISSSSNVSWNTTNGAQTTDNNISWTETQATGTDVVISPSAFANYVHGTWSGIVLDASGNLKNKIDLLGGLGGSTGQAPGHLSASEICFGYDQACGMNTTAILGPGVTGGLAIHPGPSGMAGGYMGDMPFEAGGLFSTAGAAITGTLNTYPLTLPNGPALTVVGTPGTATASSSVVCHAGNGVTSVSPTTTITNAPNALNNTNYVNITMPTAGSWNGWNYFPLSCNWDILWGDNAHSLVTGATPTNGVYSMQGQATAAYSAPSRNSTGDVNVGGNLTFNGFSAGADPNAVLQGSLLFQPQPTDSYINMDVTLLPQGTGNESSINFFWNSDAGLAHGAGISVTPSGMTLGGFSNGAYVPVKTTTVFGPTTTLDDGHGNMSVYNNLTVGGSLTLTSQSANLFMASPSGNSGAPSFRSIVAADLPSSITSNTSGNAATAMALTGTPTQCSGNNFSTGITASGNANCLQPAFTNLSGSLAMGQSPLTTAGDLLFANNTPALTRLGIGSTNQFLGISSGLPAWVQPAFSNLSGSATTGQLPGNGATTVNGQNCTLNSTCTIPFQTNGTGNTSQAGINHKTSTVNAVGLTVTPTNPGTNQETFEITGSSYSGNAATATALASTPSQCSGNNFATGVAASGNANCSQPAASNLTNGVTGSGSVVLQTSPQISSPSLGPGSSPLTQTWTVGIGGVTANTLVQTDTSAPSKIIATSTTVYGIAMSTVSSGTVEVARYGTVNCVADTGGATSGDLVIMGTGAAYDCKDSGQTISSNISIGTRVLGVFRSSASAGSPALVELTPAHFGTGLASANAGTATALASAPAQCAGNNFSTGIAASGNANCMQPAFSNLSGSATTSQLPGSGATTVNGQTCALNSTCNVNNGASQYTLAVNGAAGAAMGGIGPGTAGQIPVSAGSSANPGFKDFVASPMIIPAANCNNATAGTGWSLPISGAPTAACRTGTNVQAGVLQFAASNTAQFQVDIPGDWDNTSTVYAKIYFTQAVNTTASQTIIMKMATGCSSTTDDPSFNTAQSFGTATTGTTANTPYTETLSSVTMTGCSAGGNLNVQISRSGSDTATTAPNVYWVSLTFQRLLSAGAN